MNEEPKEQKKVKKIFSGDITIKLLVLILVVVLIAGIINKSAAVVPNSTTGVVKRFGAAQDNTLSEGLHFVIPFADEVSIIDNHILKADIEGEASSRDLQLVQYQLTVNYMIPANASLSIFKQVGLQFEQTLLNPAMAESLKMIMSNYTAEELITKRQEVANKIMENISETMKEYGVTINKISITNLNFSAEFNAAVEAKQTAQQQALKAEQDLARVKVEAQQKIEQAKGEAEAYRIQNEALSDKNIKIKWIEKWNGELPQTVAGDSEILITPSNMEETSSTSTAPAQNN